MIDHSQRIADLSPGKRALLMRRLAARATGGVKPPIIPPRPTDGDAPASLAQRRLWFLDQLQPGSALYLIPAALEMTGSLDAAALQHTLNEIVRRHESLRTTFYTLDDQPMQHIGPELMLDLPVIDLRDRAAPDRWNEALRLATEEAQRPFDLSRGPLVRATLLRLADDQHVLLITLHHIIADGWSCGVLLTELAALYAAYVNNRPSPLPALPLQYADFAHWQWQWLQGEVLDRQLSYWKQQLDGAPAALELPTDHPRSGRPTQQGAHLSFTLDATLSDQLRALARHEEATLFMVLLAAFHTLLHRYTGQTDICVGTAVANRDRAEIESLIGFFVNTLPLRLDVSGEPSFRQLLKRVHEIALGAYAHQDVPFDLIVEALSVDREAATSPLFQVVFDLQTAALPRLQLPGLEIDLLPIERGTSKFDLALSLEDDPAGLRGTLEYTTDLFERATMSRWLEHFQTLLCGIVADPDRSIATLPLLSAAEEQRLIEWNATDVDIPLDRCVPQLFEAQAEQTPAALAVATGTNSLTYAELNRRANQLAHRLHKLGVGPETIVGLCVNRSLDLIVGALGVLKAGGAYLPIDPSYPPERIAFMLEDSQAIVLLTQAHLTEDSSFTLQPSSFEVICLDTDWPLIASENDENPSCTTTIDNLAYVIYTSGSTGQPKGVTIEHHSLLNLVFWHRRVFGVTATDRATQLAGQGFDASVWEVWPYLTAGASLHIPNDETRTSPQHLRDWLVSTAITITFLPTPLAESVLLLGWPRETALRYLLTGGDKLHVYPPPDLPFQLINNYGPTEDTVVTTSGRVPANASIEAAPSIGRPIDNTRLYILDQHLQPVPIGVPGELHIGGVGLARGYLRRPDLTTEKFINYSFSSPASRGGREEACSRLYKTGDLVRYRSNGEIEFLSRIDQQVKVRGFRIELGEIEAALTRHPAIKTAAVIAHADEVGGPRLAAYFVPQQLPAPSSVELRAFLKRTLPDYMVPTAFVVLETLPLTPNGKVDRRALPAPEWLSTSGEYSAPRTPVEEILAGIWSQVLNVKRVSIHDDFFELGGHSLLATQVMSRVRDTFHIDLPLRSLFEASTVAELARSVEAARSGAQTEVSPITRRDATDLPLSYAQQRLWFLDRLEPGSPLYNVAAAVRLTGSLDVTALERSLNEVVRRHEVLRATFPAIDGQAQIVVVPALNLALPVTDLQTLPQSDRDSAAQRLLCEEAQRPFDLSSGPLLRVHLIRLSPSHHLLLFSIHHIVFDGWSTSVLIRETAALYDAFTHDRSSSLPELLIQYADFACWQRQTLTGKMLEQQLAYWTHQLDGELPVLNLPTDRPRPALQTNHGAQVTFTLPADLSLALNDLSRQSGVTLFMTLLAAFAALLQRYTGQDDICVGTPIANRTRAEIEGLIGCFVNTLVMRIRLDSVSGAPTFRELLQRVRDVALNAYAHQDLPFEMIVDALHLSRNLSHTPLFQAMLVLQNAPAQSLELPGLTVTEVPVDVGIANFDLTLTLQDQPAGLCGVFEYNIDLFDAATIERLAQHLGLLLDGIVVNPDRPIAALPIMSEAEEHRLLIEWNDAHADYAIEHCVHHLFEAQAARTPDTLALVGDQQSLTYRELNRRANQLAHYLRGLNVGPETLVGLCAERSIELLIGLLGILKAGGAYVPLDPTYPAERLAFMLADSQVRVLLTQSHLKATSSLIPQPSSFDAVCLDADWPLIEQCSTANVEVNVTPDNVAYVIYTSGSTGQPKGVMISHRSLVNHNLAVQRAFQLTPADRVLQFATINFDTAAEEIYPTWLSGATLVLRPNDLLTGAELLALIEREQLTVLDLPTAYWHEWVYELSLAPQPLPPSLRLVIVGGEKVSAERYALWQKVGGARVRWLNTYGPTEGTIIASIYEPPLDQPLSGEVPIGRPLANDQLYILDRDLRPVPIGVPGELHIGGAGVARGYLNQPQLTAERFIPNPFSPHAGGGSQRGVLYKTGDLARYRADGNVEFVGRADQQVKVRGFRIELGEIEAALAQHPQVREAAVVVREDSPGDRRLVAYVVTNQPVEANELRAFLKARLPDYMLPAAFVTLDTLPLTPNHKVDRRALPAPDEVSLMHADETAGPRTIDEQTLAKIWKQVLGVKYVGVHDNFFELGGDSILSIQVIARANQAGLHLTPRQLFEHPTVAELAAVADRAVATSAEQGAVIGPVPFTPIQRWFFEQDWPNPHHWKQTLLLKIDQYLDSALVKQAIEQLVIHHDALRLRFERTSTSWQQHISALADADGAFTYVDMSDVPDTGLCEAIETAAAWLRAMVNLRDGSLLRVAFFNCGATRASRLLLSAHHLVIDTVSWRILLEDFQRVYQQLTRGAAVQLPLKTTSFKQWAERLIAYAQSPAAQREFAFWQSQARDVVARLPRDFTHGANLEASAHTIKTALSVEDTHALLHEIPAVYQTEINDVLLTALTEALSGWIGSRALLIDQEGHGREALFDDVDLSRTVGWFTTVYPVRLDLRGVSDPGAALKAIKEQLRRVPHHGIGYGLLRYLCADHAIVTGLRQLPQPEISFNYLGQFDQALNTSFALAPAPEPTGTEHSPSDQRTHLLEVTGSIVGGQLQLEWIYSANLHRAETVERVANDFIAALRALIQHCQSPEAGGYTPSDFPDVELSEADLAALLAETGA